MPDPVSVPPAARDAILAWYDHGGRTLPFRRTNDPYAVLVSELMAQQTQAARAGEAWVRFMERFPDVRALAASSPADVLRSWQGLGYNRRALNLWRTARRIVDIHDGRVPSDLRSLEALPGIGPYTARAIAAITFGQPVGAVDTNVRRVLGRIAVGASNDLTGPELQRLADATVAPDRPADWTHALMDVGAMICRPRRPDCVACPARSWCRLVAQDLGRVDPTPPANQPSHRRRAEAPFPSTTRWLRGRIVDRLRSAPDGTWTNVDGPIGDHDQAAVRAAVTALVREGLVELDPAAAVNGRAGHLVRLSLA